MKKLAIWTLILSVLLTAIPTAFAREDTGVVFKEFRIPALGEKLETPAEAFTYNGVTFGIYGIDKTDEEVLIYAYIKNDTSDTVHVDLDKEYRTYVDNTFRTYYETADLPKEEWPAAGTQADVTYRLSYPSESQEVSDSMTSFSFDVYVMAGIRSICAVKVSFHIGEALPCELDFNDPNIPIFRYKRGNRAPLFSAEDISVGLMDGIAAGDATVMSLSYTSYFKPIRIAVENLVINGEPVADTFEYELEIGSDIAEIVLPFGNVKTMTFDFAVYDGETGEQIFEKTKVILGGEIEAE